MTKNRSKAQILRRLMQLVVPGIVVYVAVMHQMAGGGPDGKPSADASKPTAGRDRFFFRLPDDCVSKS